MIRIINPSWKLLCYCVNYVSSKKTSFISSAGNSLLIKPKINPTFKIDISKTMTTNAEVISSTADFVKNALEGNDGSHDFAHIERVWNLAKTIGKHTENLSPEDILVVELSALLHDVDDWKYAKEKSHLEEYFKTFQAKLAPGLEDRIRFIIKNVSFHTEIGFSKEEYSKFMEKEPALAIVQDADRLDAIGAIGIARCFTFGGIFLKIFH